MAVTGRKKSLWSWIWLLTPLLLLGGCTDGDDSARTGGRLPVPAPSSGLWKGTFPCADCPGIEVTLWLHPDGAFFLRQHYLADDGDGERYYGIGRWEWDEDEPALRLRSGGPERVFDHRGPGLLAMRVASDLPHRLERSGDLVPFTDTIVLEGEYQVAEGERRFRECRSGLTWPIAPRGDYRRLLHQYGRVPRGEDALARVRGRLERTDNGDALLVEELVQLQPGRRCP
ncbi:copper resistance protein NlpE N-terminal domain-containing protein [Lentisalinibacter salinarum]|uniref:copper resistance protein NlpE N-terminal domain-containing protein n=1 Tax=Lentisalinibacter salinarum TaxID=2992239 RepID=UPI0038692E5D